MLKKRTLLEITSVILTVIVAGVALSFVLMQQINSTFIEEEKLSLSSMASELASHLDAQGRATIYELQTLARDPLFADPEANEKDRQDLMASEAEKNRFVRLGYSDVDGYAKTSDGQILQIGDREYFPSVIRGKSEVSKVYTDRLGNHEPIVVVAVPVWWEGKVTGLLFATSYLQNYIATVNQTTYPGKDHILLIDQKGAIIASSGLSDRENLFSQIERETSSQEYQYIVTNIAKNVGGSGYFVANEKEHIVGYAPVEISSGWTITTSATVDTVLTQARSITASVFIFVGLMMALIAGLAGYIILKRDMFDKQQREQDSRVAQALQFDVETGLRNREGLINAIDAMFQRLKPHELSSIMIFEVTSLKATVNLYGPEVGTKVIAEIAQKLHGLESDRCVPARMSNRTFALYANGFLMRTECRDYARKVQNMLYDTMIIDGIEIRSHITMGVRMYPKVENEVVDQVDILVGAERALAKAKKTKDKTSYFFDQAMEEELRRLKVIQQELPGALERDEFSLLYQPQYDVKSSKIVGFEALLRWKNRELGGVTFADFIATANNLGLIIDIGKWVIDQTFAAAASLKDTDIVLSCNVSVAEVLRIDFVSFVAERFKYYGLRSGLVGLEFTESTIAECHEDLVVRFAELRSLGIKILLDDFGTGYSSLSYLSSLPIDVIKIDRCFVDAIEFSKHQQNVVESTMNLANKSKVGVIAEGVETSGQLEVLSHYGCSFGQGYYFSRPVSYETLLSMVLEQSEIQQ